MVCQSRVGRTELKFSMSEVTLTRLHAYCAASVPLRRFLCPNLAEALCAHLEVSLLATPWRQGHRVQGRVLEGDWGWGISPVCRHSVSLSLAQLSATVFRKEGLEAWPQLMQLLQHSIRSLHVPEREVLSHGWWEEGTQRLDRPCKLFPLNPSSWADGAFAAKCGGDLPA